MMYTFDIVKFPAMDVASIQIKNPDSEADSLEKVIDFIISNKLDYLYYNFPFQIPDDDVDRGILDMKELYKTIN